MAEWLDTVFQSFDLGILSALHDWAATAEGTPLTWLMHFISLFAHDGIFMLLLGIALMCFRRTRKAGICVIGAVCCGALITNVAVKGLVDRMRPYAGHLSETIREWWEFTGSARAAESPSRSFPSGHTTATTAAMLGLFLSTDKKRTWPVLLAPFLMGLSRMYLMVHYPTDVIAGLLVGAVGAVAAFFITKLIYRILERHGENRFCRFCLEFDLIEWIKSFKKHTKDAEM